MSDRVIRQLAVRNDTNDDFLDCHRPGDWYHVPGEKFMSIVTEVHESGLWGYQDKALAVRREVPNWMYEYEDDMGNPSDPFAAPDPRDSWGPMSV